MADTAEKKPEEKEDIRDRLLSRIAHGKLTADPPIQEGASYFYEVRRGWETAIFQMDRNVRRVNSPQDLEDAFMSDEIRTVFIPRQASITKNIARRLCRRHGHGKTVFFEVDDNE